MIVEARGSRKAINGKSPGDVSLKLSDLKFLIAKWVVEIHCYLQQQKDPIIKGFEKDYFDDGRSKK